MILVLCSSEHRLNVGGAPLVAKLIIATCLPLIVHSEGKAGRWEWSLQPTQLETRDKTTVSCGVAGYLCFKEELIYSRQKRDTIKTSWACQQACG